MATAAANVDDLLKELEQSMESYQLSRTKSQRGRARSRQSTAAAAAAGGPGLPGQSPRQQPAQMAMARQPSQAPSIQRLPSQQPHAQASYQPQVQQVPQQQQQQQQYGGPSADDEISRLREELARAHIELERQKSITASQLPRQNSDFSGNVFSAASSAPVPPPKFESAASTYSADSNTTSAATKSAKSRAVSSKTAAKSAYGWTGKCSVRQPGRICDAILDEACNLDYEPVPYSICASIANQVKEYYYEKTNKGQGASQAIMSIMYMINLEDPELVRRGMEVLEIMYHLCGPIFWQNVNLNLDFFVFFLETRKHLTEPEKDNVKYLAGIFAGWYLIDANKRDLEDAGHMADPTIRIKQFFEGLLRAGYEFPQGSLDALPRDKLAAITSSWSRGPFSFSKFKK